MSNWKSVLSLVHYRFLDHTLKEFWRHTNFDFRPILRPIGSRDYSKDALERFGENKR